MNHLERALINQNQWWKYLIIFFVGFIVANAIGAIPLIIVIGIKLVQNGGEIDPAPENALDFSAYGIDPNFGLILLLLPFVFSLISISLMFKPLHKMNVKEVINGTNTIRWEKFFFAAGNWGLIMIVYLLIAYSFNPENFNINLNISTLIPLVIISIIFIPLQATFEEILFRGYLAQGVAVFTKNRWLVIVIPSILFMLMHSVNPEVKEYGFRLVMPQYLIFGLLFGLISTLDDGIEAAMGAHTANNIFGSIFITSKASVLPTAALFEEVNLNPINDTKVLLITSILFMVILTNKYKWDFSILKKQVE